MTANTLNFESSIAVYLKSKGYIRTLQNFLLESPFLLGRNEEDFDNDLSDCNFEQLADDLKRNAGTYTILSQAIHQMETAMTTMKFGLGLSHRRPNGSLTHQTRFYSNHHSTIPKPLQFDQIERSQPRQRQAQSTMPRPRPFRRPLEQTAPVSSASSMATAAATSIEAANQAEATPVRQHFGSRLSVVKEVTNTTTPTRRQLFASPASKRKTPNPKHQLTPLGERDLLDEALKQCSISPSAWERRITDSALPEQLAAAINNALVNICAPAASTADEQSPASFQVGGYGDASSDYGNADNDGPSSVESQAETAVGTEAVISGAMYQIGTNPNLFQSLEQLFMPDYNDSGMAALENEVDRFNDLRTPGPNSVYADFETPLAFNYSATSSTLAQCSDTPRFLITPTKNVGQRPLLPKPSSVEKLFNQSPTLKSPARRKALVARPLFNFPGEQSSAPRNKKPRSRSPIRPQSPSVAAISVEALPDQAASAPNDNPAKDGSSEFTAMQPDCRQQAEPSTSRSSLGYITNGNSTPATSTKSKPAADGTPRFPSSEMLTPDRIDALMKRLHKKQ